jgi:hypothetical protein
MGMRGGGFRDKQDMLDGRRDCPSRWSLLSITVPRGLSQLPSHLTEIGAGIGGDVLFHH